MSPPKLYPVAENLVTFSPAFSSALTSSKIYRARCTTPTTNITPRMMHHPNPQPDGQLGVRGTK